MAVGFTLSAEVGDAAVGSELHGLAGEIACREKGVYGMNAEDIVRAIPAAMGRYA